MNCFPSPSQQVNTFPLHSNDTAPLVKYTTPYPSHAFTDLPGELARSLIAGGAAPELVGTVLIAIISLLTQGIADVVWPNGQKSPIGVSGMVVAPSGFGKTVTLKIFMNPIERCLHRLCQIDEKYLDFLIEDITREAIVESLARLPIACLVTDEVRLIQHLFRHAPTLVKPIDGSPLRNARVGTGRKAIINARLLMLLMAQPDVFEAIKNTLVAKGGVGLGNRILFAPCNDLVASPTLHHVRLNNSLEFAYEEKVASLLDTTFRQIENPKRERPTLLLSAQASEFLIGHSSDVQRNCLRGAPWFPISEYASRHAERILRLAGAFHVFEYGIQGEISLDTIQRAATLGLWHIEAFARMMYEPPNVTQAEADVIELESVIHYYFHTTGNSRLPESEIRSSAMNLGMTSTRLTRVLAYLGGDRKIFSFKHLGKPWIELNVAYFSQYR